jgi:Cu+-exporting ATPase
MRWCGAGRGLRAEGASVMHLAVDGQLARPARVSDPIKAARRGAGDTARAGLRVVMATGDGLTTARAVARVWASTRCTARSSRRQAGNWSSAAEAKGRVVAMAGDGINDAPALARPMSASPWAPAPTWR